MQLSTVGRKEVLANNKELTYLYSIVPRTGSTMVTVPPLVGGEDIIAIVKGLPSGSLSFESTSATTAVSSSVEMTSSVAVGAALPEAETKMDIVAVEVSPFPSEIVYSNSSGPEKLGLGLQSELENSVCGRPGKP